MIPNRSATRPRSIERRLRRASAVVVAVALLAGAVPALAHGPDPIMGGALFAQDQRVLFKWRAGAAPPPSIATAIKAAAADASLSRGSRAATFAFDAAGTSQIGYGTEATCGVNGIACFDRSGAPASFTMWLREQGHDFDWGTLKWCQTYAVPPNGCYDAETIALDEFGHVEVLNHHVNFVDDSDYLDAVVQAVSRTKPKAGWDLHAFARCDVATLQRKYDVPTSTTLISTCLDLDTTLALKSSATSVTYGASVTLTATLKVDDQAAYDRLRANSLSQRTVKLQRRAAGSTTWSTLATMSPASTAGTYATTTSVSTTYEYRAVFSAPASEGLAGATSGTIKVTMSGCGGSACPQSQPASPR